MKIKYSPQYKGQKKNYSQPSKDVLKIDEVEYDFSDTNIVEFNVEEAPGVISAKRINGVLHLELTQGYSASEKDIWENKEYCSSGYKGSDFEEYGESEVLS